MRLIAFYIAICSAEINGYVTTNIKYEGTTTKFNDLSDENANSEPSKDDENFSGYIYMDDVVFGLKSQNWTKEELSCLNDTLLLIRSLQNYTLWAVWEWDSVASQPLGILSGNRFQLGNFDQCMSSPWGPKHKEINTQYCLAEVVLERNDHVKKKRLDQVKPYENALDYIQHHTPYYRPLKYLTWGACVPVSCEPRSVERLVGAVLARSHLGAAGLRPHIVVNETCQRPDQPKKFEASFYGFFALTAFMFFLCLLCTIFNQTNNERSTRSGTRFNFCKAFCLVENSKALLKMNKDGIEIVYGIKYLTICFIVICHQGGILNSGPISNGLQVDENLYVFGWLTLHDDLLVDTFFVLSGFLLAKTLVQYKNLPSILLVILKRYVRLVVALAVVVFFIVAVFPHMGSGPLWNRYVEMETGTCRRNWWLNVLMLSNYINPESVCLVISWYIPCDFHYFVISVLTFSLYKRLPKIGLFCAGALCVASVITPGIVNYINKLGAIQLFTYDFLANPRANEQFVKTYIKSHTRAAAYVVGFFAGYVFAKYNKSFGKMSQSKSIIGFCTALIIMVLVAMLGVSYHYRTYSQMEGAFYAALNRPIWAVGVVLMLYSCVYGSVPLINGFLTWYPWVPLSRLAYGVYLVHTVIISRNVAVVRSPVYYDSFVVILNSLSVIALSTFLAYILWLLFEAPVNNLLNVYFKRKPTHTTNREENVTNRAENYTKRENSGIRNSGYIEDNLAQTIEFSSKM